MLGPNLQQKDTLEKSAQFWSIQTKHKSLNSIYTVLAKVQFHIMGTSFTNKLFQMAALTPWYNVHMYTNEQAHTAHVHTHTHTHVHTAAGCTIHVFLFHLYVLLFCVNIAIFPNSPRVLQSGGDHKSVSQQVALGTQRRQPSGLG